MMEEPTTRDKELAKILEEFEDTVYYKALLESIENMEFNYLQALLTCDESELSILRAKAQSLREFLALARLPIMKMENYNAQMEQQRIMKEAQHGGF